MKPSPRNGASDFSHAIWRNRLPGSWRMRRLTAARCPRQDKSATEDLIRAGRPCHGGRHTHRLRQELEETYNPFGDGKKAGDAETVPCL